MAETAGQRWERLTGNPGGSTMGPSEIMANDFRRAGFNSQIEALNRRINILTATQSEDGLRTVRQLKAKIAEVEKESASYKPVHCSAVEVIAAEIDMLEERRGTAYAQEHDEDRLVYLRTSHPAAAVLADSNNETMSIAADDVGTLSLDDEERQG